MQGLKRLSACLFILITTLPITANAKNYPQPTGYVNDFAGVLETVAETQLTNVIREFERATGNEIAVATLKSLGGEPIENYAVRLFEEWRIGKKGQDNGILILLAPNEREARIEVGYGLEPYINDALAGRIIRDTMIPRFKEGNFSAGILNGTTEIISIIAKKTNVEFDPDLYHVSAEARPQSIITKLLKLIVAIFIILLFIKNPWAAFIILSGMRGGRGGSFRGGFGGGFGGFGGGLSGGGGATGRW